MVLLCTSAPGRYSRGFIRSLSTKGGHWSLYGISDCDTGILMASQAFQNPKTQSPADGEETPRGATPKAQISESESQAAVSPEPSAPDTASSSSTEYSDFGPKVGFTSEEAALYIGFSRALEKTEAPESQQEVNQMLTEVKDLWLRGSSSVADSLLVFLSYVLMTHTDGFSNLYSVKRRHILAAAKSALYAAQTVDDDVVDEVVNKLDADLRSPTPKSRPTSAGSASRLEFGGLCKKLKEREVSSPVLAEAPAEQSSYCLACEQAIQGKTDLQPDELTRLLTDLGKLCSTPHLDLSIEDLANHFDKVDLSGIQIADPSEIGKGEDAAVMEDLLDTTSREVSVASWYLQIPFDSTKFTWSHSYSYRYHFNGAGFPPSNGVINLEPGEYMLDLSGWIGGSMYVTVDLRSLSPLGRLVSEVLIGDIYPSSRTLIRYFRIKFNGPRYLCLFSKFIDANYTDERGCLVTLGLSRKMFPSDVANAATSPTLPRRPPPSGPKIAQSQGESEGSYTRYEPVTPKVVSRVRFERQETEEEFYKAGTPKHPGPGVGNMFIDSLLSLCDTNDDVRSAVWLLYSQLAKDFNPFAVLQPLDTEDIEDPLLMEVIVASGDSSETLGRVSVGPETKAQTGQERRRPPPNANSDRGGGKDSTDDNTAPPGPKKRRVKESPPAPNDAREKNTSPKDVTGFARRIVAAFRGKGRDGGGAAFVSWCYDKAPDKRLILTISRLLWGSKWTDETVLSASKYAVYCMLNVVSCDEIFCVVYAAWCAGKKGKHDLPSPSLMFRELTGSHLEMAARNHNKEMHALNGNIFNKDWEEILGNKDWTTVAEEDVGMSRNNATRIISNYQEILANFPSVAARNLQRLSDQDGFVGDLTDRDNVTHRGVRVRFPATNLTPTRIPIPTRDAEGNPEYAHHYCRTPAPVTACYVEEYYHNVLEPTDLARNTLTKLEEGVSTRVRQNDITKGGLHSLDVQNFAGVSTTHGYNTESMVMKVLLLADIYAYQANPQIPNSVYSAIIPNVVPEGTAEVVCNGYSPFNPRVGKLVYPFTGKRGELRFHASFETVADGNRDRAIVIPPTMLQVPGAQELMVLTIMAFLEWPTLQFSVTIAANRAGGDWEDLAVERAVYTHLACLLRVPGLEDIEVVLPRLSSEHKFPSVERATAAVRTPPTYGPGQNLQPIRVWAGQQPLALNGDTVSVIDYMLSWLPYITKEHINRWLICMHTIGNIRGSVAKCHELIAMMVYNQPCLQVDGTIPENWDPDQYTWRDPEGVDLPDAWRVWPSPQQMYLHTGYMGRRDDAKPRDRPVWRIACRVVGRTPMSAPWHHPDPTCILYGMNYLSWNLVIYGLAHSIDTETGTDITPGRNISSDQFVYHQVLRSLILNTAYHFYFSVVGLPEQEYERAWTANPHDAVHSNINALWAQVRPQSQWYPPLAQQIMYSLFCHMSRLVVEVELVKIGGLETIMTVFGRGLRPRHLATQIYKFKAGTAEANPTCALFRLNPPHTQIDVWFYLLTEENLLGFGNIVSGYINKGSYGFNKLVKGEKAMVPVIFPNRVGPYVENFHGGYMAQNQGLDFGDEQIWNSRLFYTTVGVTLVNGLNVVVEAFDCDRNPCQRTIQDGWPIVDGDVDPHFEQVPKATFAEYLASSTTSKPAVLDQEVPIFPMIDTNSPELNGLVMAMNGRIPVKRAVWHMDGASVEVQGMPVASGTHTRMGRLLAKGFIKVVAAAEVPPETPPGATEATPETIAPGTTKDPVILSTIVVSPPTGGPAVTQTVTSATSTPAIDPAATS